MGHKICKNCGEINSSSAIYCAICNSSLKDVKKKEDTINSTSSIGNSAVYNGAEDVTLGKWIIILVLLAIPILDIFVIVVLAFAWNNTSINNFGKATLILSLIVLIIIFLFRGCSCN